jgi:hypothetical protein
LTYFKRLHLKLNLEDFMFARPIFSNLLQPFAAGFSPLTVGTGFSVLNPYLALQPYQIGTFGGFSPFSPLPPQFGGYGFSPPTVPLGAGVLPFPTSHFSPIPTPVTNPLAYSQLPSINLPIPPTIVPQGLGGQLYQGLLNPMFQGGINSMPQIMGGEASYFGLSPFSTQFGWGTASPYLAQEPIVNSLLAQQLNPLAQQRMPIRSLVNQQQIDPFQTYVSGIPGLVSNQAIDPYSLLAQAQLMSQFGAIPIQQIVRPYPSANWFGQPYAAGQTFPIAQTGLPYV